MRYHVKFQWQGSVKYGIIQSFLSEEDAKQQPKGCLLVEDAILPKRYWVNESDITDIPWLSGGNEFDRFVAAEREKADKINKGLGKSPPVQVGRLFRIGVGDGYATYVVVKVNKKTCQVEWRGFSGDRWLDHHFGWGGTYPISDIARYMR